MSPDQYLPIAIPIVVIALILLRNRRSRKLHPQWMWVTPVIVLPLIGMGLYFTPHAPFGAGAWLSFALALVLGAAAGWWRGKTVRIEKHPDGHLTAQASPLGLILLVGLFAVRAGLRALMETGASAWHVDAAIVTDAFLLFAVGLIVAQRVEMYLRARRVLAGGGDSRVEAVAG